MLRLLRVSAALASRFFRSRRDLLPGNLALRQQLTALKHRHPQPRLVASERSFRSEVGMGQSIWNSMQQKGYSRRDFLQFCAAAATVAGLRSIRRGPGRLGLSRRKKTGRRLDALSGVHLLQRVVHSRIAPHRSRCAAGRADLELHRDADGRLRLPGGKVPHRHHRRTTRASTLCWWRARCPRATTASTA
jgi:hypothetical protein